MAITHIVWIKFNHGVADTRIAEHITALKSLKDNVPGIIELSIGENFTDRADGHSHGLVVILDDKTALATYLAHPNHVEVATALREDATLMALDFET